MQSSPRRTSRCTTARRRFGRIRFALPLGLAACSVVGPASIDQSRTQYNEIIQATAKQQTLLNIVRVSDGESPLFMDVTEVDAATTLQGSISGGPSGLGATANFKGSSGTIAGPVGFITASGLYQEAPTVRYQPLLGQPLIAQVATPLTAEALANLFNSDWPLAAVLTLGIDRLTLGYSDYDAAVNAIVDLDNYGAIVIEATSSANTKKQPEKHSGTALQDKSLTVTVGSPPPATKDTLTIYYAPKDSAISQAACDVAVAGRSDNELTQPSRMIVKSLWQRLQAIYDVKDDVINISAKGNSGLNGEPAKPPLFLTRSALGILKAASEQDDNPFIAILPVQEVRDLIKAHDDRSAKGCTDDFYTLPPGAEADKSPSARAVADRLANTGLSMITMFPEAASLNLAQLQTEKKLGNYRRFMLIAISKNLPDDAFVSVNHKGLWYYILDDDTISKRTLALINEFNTILAVPTSTPPLTPSISVGARP